jgi:LysM repeat protein
MRRFPLFLAAFALCAPLVRAQDAATEERLNKLTGQVEDLIAGQKALQKHVADLSREIDSLREQMGRPNASYATQDEIKRLTENLREVDRKRIEDAERIHSELLKLGKSLEAPPPKPKKTTPPAGEKSGSEKPATPDKGYEYTVEKGDTLSLIVQAYREKNIKITTDQILKANPGLKPERLRPGMKIFIPAPPS